MELTKLKLLEEKYWAGETDAQEEEQLKSYVLSGETGLSQEFVALVFASNTYADLKIPRDFDDKFWKQAEGKGATGFKLLQFSTALKYAAAIVVILGIGLAIYTISMKFDSSPAHTFASEEFIDTYSDPQKAYEETRRALLMVSSKLNEAEQPVLELKRFHESKMSITGAPATNNNH